MNEEDKAKFQSLLAQKDSDSESLRHELQDISERLNHLSEENYTLRNQIQPKDPWPHSATDRSQQNDLISELRKEKKELHKELERLRAKTLKKEIKIAKLEKENDLLKTRSDHHEAAAVQSCQAIKPTNRHKSFSRHASVDRHSQMQHLLTAESLNPRDPHLLSNSGPKLRLPSSKKPVDDTTPHVRKDLTAAAGQEVAAPDAGVTRPVSDKNRKHARAFAEQRQSKEQLGRSTGTARRGAER